MDLSSEFDGEMITSFVERRNFQLEPLASTETITGFYMHTDSATPATAVVLDIDLQAVNTATVPVSFAEADNVVGYEFNIGGDSPDYKIDTRLNGRLLNYRISNTGSTAWEIQAFGVAVDQGGTR